VNLGDAFRHLIMVDYEFCGANIEGFYFSWCSQIGEQRILRDRMPSSQLYIT
jgi:hypothetical protein